MRRVKKRKVGKADTKSSTARVTIALEGKQTK